MVLVVWLYNVNSNIFRKPYLNENVRAFLYYFVLHVKKSEMEGAADHQELMDAFVKACETGDVKITANLIKWVSKPSFPRKVLEAKLGPPIYWACKGGHLEIVKLLIEKYPSCDPLFVNDNGCNLLYIACVRGHISLVNYFHEVHSISSTEPNNLGTTPIFAATYNGHLKMLEFLIYKLKCDPQQLNSSGESLLHIACGRNHQDIVRYLVEEHHLNPSLESLFKKTPLHSACSSGNLSIVKYLVKEQNCKVEVFDQAGYTPLHSACRNGHDAIVGYFIECKQDLYLYDSSGYIPLHVGCRFGRKGVVKTLLSTGGVDPNFPTITGHAPLQITRDDDTDIIRHLIRHGASTLGIVSHIFQDYRLKYPLHSNVRIFMIGHSASGKSTLAKALQHHSSTFFNIGRTNVHVKPHTVGVIPIEFDSHEFGNVLLYDFAGDYEFHPSHAALLEHSKFTSPPLFVLVVNLLNSYEELKRYVYLVPECG